MREMIYNLIENGQIVMKGTAKEIASELKMKNYNSITQCAKRGQRLRRKYTLEHIGYTDETKPQKLKHQYDLEWIRLMLLMHPFTSYHTDGSEFADELKACGITFRAEKHPQQKKVWYLYRT